jgi:phosphatidylserine decarboxylase
MIVRDGWIFILIGIVLTITLLWLATKWDSRTLFGISVLSALLTLFVVYFFRDPDRTAPSEPGALVAPADGRIVQIDTLADHPFVGPNTLQVSIFLSVFDVHVNRTPASGRVDFVKYHPGKFLAAFNDKASLENEQTEIGMTTASGERIAFKQIAGLIARRIVCRLKEGDRVDLGERFGMIKFGSRTDLLIPEGTRLAVKLGDHVRGGETVMGRLSDSAPRSDNSSAKENVNGRL